MNREQSERQRALREPFFLRISAAAYQEVSQQLRAIGKTHCFRRYDKLAEEPGGNRWVIDLSPAQLGPAFVGAIFLVKGDSTTCRSLRHEIDELVALAESADEDMMEAIRADDILEYCAAAAIYLAVFASLRQIQGLKPKVD